MDFILTEAAFDSQFRREPGVEWIEAFGDNPEAEHLLLARLRR